MQKAYLTDTGWTVRRWLWPSVALLCALLAAGCKKSSETPAAGGGDAGGGTIKVGEFASLTGKEATFGVSSHEGTLLGVEQINANGGVLGKKLELLTEDDLSKAGEPATAVN